RSLSLPALRPATTEHLVERNAVGLFRQVRADQSLLRGIQAALRIKQVEEAVDAALVTRPGEFVRFRGGIEQGLQRGATLAQAAAQGQRIGHFAEARLDRSFVLRERNVALG